LEDPRVPDGQSVQTIIPNNAAFQTEDLDIYDSDCNDLSNAQAVLMANISNYGSDVISEGRQGQSYSGTGYKSHATSFGGNNSSGHAKDKAMLAEAQEVEIFLDEEQLAFLEDPRVPDGQSVQTIIPNNAAFQTEDLDIYDSDCNDLSNAQAVLMANISNYGSDVISEVPHSETYLNDMKNQSVLAMQD
nr:hypothetical protein [Tanacetum cinerariifolium]